MRNRYSGALHVRADRASLATPSRRFIIELLLRSTGSIPDVRQAVGVLGDTYTKKTAIWPFFLYMCPREESNLDFEFRKLMSYPLNDGDKLSQLFYYTYECRFLQPCSRNSLTSFCGHSTTVLCSEFSLQGKYRRLKANPPLKYINQRRFYLPVLYIFL